MLQLLLQSPYFNPYKKWKLIPSQNNTWPSNKAQMLTAKASLTLQPPRFLPGVETVSSKGPGPPSSGTIQSALTLKDVKHIGIYLSFGNDNPKSTEKPKLEAATVKHRLRWLKDTFHHNNLLAFLIFPLPPLSAAVFR